MLGLDAFQYGETILDILSIKQPYILVICMLFIYIYVVNHVFLYYKYYKGFNSSEHLIMAEKCSFGWELNHTPHALQATALTIRPPQPPISHCPSTQRTCFYY